MFGFGGEYVTPFRVEDVFLILIKENLIESSCSKHWTICVSENQKKLYKEEKINKLMT